MAHRVHASQPAVERAAPSRRSVGSDVPSTVGRLADLADAVRHSPVIQARTRALAGLFGERQAAPVQRSPRKKVGSDDEYEDNYYPTLKLKKVAGNKYTTIVAGTNLDLWFEEPYYYTNSDCTEDRRYTVPIPARINRIFNAYNAIVSEENEKSLYVMNIENLLKKFDNGSLELLKTETKGKTKVIKEAFPYGGSEYPIQVRPARDDKFELVNGRHRLLASIQQGFTHIPVHVL